MSKAYRLLTDSKLEPNAVAGTIVYACRGYDYGSAKDDTRMLGREHISVTLDPDGGYPFFTHPVDELRAGEEGGNG